MTDAESKAEGYVSSNLSRVKPDNILLQVSEKKRHWPELSSAVSVKGAHFPQILFSSMGLDILDLSLI